MAILAFDVTAFRAQFPGQFVDPPNTDALIETAWDAATCLVSPNTPNAFFDSACLLQLLNLVTAHILTLSNTATAGDTGGFVSNATIDKISVQVQTFESKSALQFFLFQTPYGMQAFTLLHTASAGGFYSGGRNELGSFRRSGGDFVPPSSVVSVTETDLTKCLVLTRPPSPPFAIQFGAIAGGGSVEQQLSIVATCQVLTIEFSTFAIPLTGVLEIWSGLAVNSGNSFNIYYWSADTRAANGTPDFSTTLQDVTGATENDGFSATGLPTGDPSNNPNLIAITGFQNKDAQVLNVKMSLT